MMDKAKAYDEALEKARKQRDDYQKELDKTDKNSQLADILRAGISAVEMIFPQLKDSDDERIRKQLVDIVAFIPEANFKSASREDCRTYLEKQKKQNIPLEEPECPQFVYDDILALECAMGIAYRKGNEQELYEALRSLHSRLSDVLDNQQKKPKVDIDKLRRDLYQSGYNDGYQHGKEDAQKEQESIPNTYGCLNCTKLEECKKGLTPCSGHRLKIVDQKSIGTDFRTAVKNLMNLHKIKNKFTEEDYDFYAKELLELVEQKPDWNEEDEMMRENIISDLQYFRDCATDEEAVSGYNDEIAWLKDISLNHKKFIEAVYKLWSNDWSEENEKI